MFILLRLCPKALQQDGFLIEREESTVQQNKNAPAGRHKRLMKKMQPTIVDWNRSSFDTADVERYCCAVFRGPR